MAIVINENCIAIKLCISRHGKKIEVSRKKKVKSNKGKLVKVKVRKNVVCKNNKIIYKEITKDKKDIKRKKKQKIDIIKFFFSLVIII